MFEEAPTAKTSLKIKRSLKINNPSPEHSSYIHIKESKRVLFPRVFVG